MPASERGAIVNKIGSLIERDLEELAELETLDTGKTVQESREDMADIANVFFYFAGLADKDGGEVLLLQSRIVKVKSFVNLSVSVVRLHHGTTHCFKPHGNSHLLWLQATR